MAAHRYTTFRQLRELARALRGDVNITLSAHAIYCYLRRLRLLEYARLA